MELERELSVFGTNLDVPPSPPKPSNSPGPMAILRDYFRALLLKKEDDVPDMDKQNGAQAMPADEESRGTVPAADQQQGEHRSADDELIASLYAAVDDLVQAHQSSQSAAPENDRAIKSESAGDCAVESGDDQEVVAPPGAAKRFRFPVKLARRADPRRFMGPLRRTGQQSRRTLNGPRRPANRRARTSADWPDGVPVVTPPASPRQHVKVGRRVRRLVPDREIALSELSDDFGCPPELDLDLDRVRLPPRSMRRNPWFAYPPIMLDPVTDAKMRVAFGGQMLPTDQKLVATAERWMSDLRLRPVESPPVPVEAQAAPAVMLPEPAFRFPDPSSIFSEETDATLMDEVFSPGVQQESMEVYFGSAGGPLHTPPKTSSLTMAFSLGRSHGTPM